MAEIKTEFLFTLALQFDMNIVGAMPIGIRRIARHTSGSFEGPKLKGTVLPGGGAWTILRSDDVWELEVRITLETDDRQQIYMHWKGLRHGPKDVMERLDRGEDVDPALYYFRTTPYFETSSAKYALAEPHLCDRHRRAQRESADAGGISGAVAAHGHRPSCA